MKPETIRTHADQLLEIHKTRAVHEAGHALVWWWLTRMRFCGRDFRIPPLEFVAVAAPGEDLRDIIGPELTSLTNLHSELGGMCAHGACINPVGSAATWRKRLLHSADITCLMAGLIAESVERGEEIQGEDEWRSKAFKEDEHGFVEGVGVVGSDYQRVEDRRRLLGRRWRLHLSRCFRLADHILREHPVHRSELVARLLNKGVIKGTEVFAMLDAIGPATGITAVVKCVTAGETVKLADQLERE